MKTQSFYLVFTSCLYENDEPVTKKFTHTVRKEIVCKRNDLERHRLDVHAGLLIRFQMKTRYLLVHLDEAEVL